MGGLTFYRGHRSCWYPICLLGFMTSLMKHVPRPPGKAQVGRVTFCPPPCKLQELDLNPGPRASLRILTEGNSFGTPPLARGLEGRAGVVRWPPVPCSAAIRRGPTHLRLRGRPRGATLQGPALLPPCPGAALYLLLPAGAGSPRCLLHQRASGEQLAPAAQGAPAPLRHRGPRPAAPGRGGQGHLLLGPLGEWELGGRRGVCAKAVAAGAPSADLSSRPGRDRTLHWTFALC